MPRNGRALYDWEPRQRGCMGMRTNPVTWRTGICRALRFLPPAYLSSLSRPTRLGGSLAYAALVALVHRYKDEELISLVRQLPLSASHFVDLQRAETKFQPVTARHTQILNSEDLAGALLSDCLLLCTKTTFECCFSKACTAACIHFPPTRLETACFSACPPRDVVDQEGVPV